MNGKHAYIPPGGASKYFVDNFNAFGDSGAFDSIADRLEATVNSEVASRLAVHCVWGGEGKLAAGDHV